MRTRLLDRQENLVIPQTTTDSTVSMVRTLIRHVASSADPFTPADVDAPDVLLDTEVDGVRCMLIRLHHLRPPDQAHIILSPREQEIARMVAAGYPNKTIAAVLEISSWTVGTHLRRVFAKLGVGSRAAMVARLLEDNLLTQTPSSSEQLKHGRK
jgi:DNA-binding CsgD family transcriptional regulator